MPVVCRLSAPSSGGRSASIPRSSASYSPDRRGPGRLRPARRRVGGPRPAARNRRRSRQVGRQLAGGGSDRRPRGDGAADHGDLAPRRERHLRNRSAERPGSDRARTACAHRACRLRPAARRLAADLRGAYGVLHLRPWATRLLPERPRRRDLERGEPCRVLGPAGRGRRVRGAARPLPRPAACGTAGCERDLVDRRPRRLARHRCRSLHPRDRPGLSREPAGDSDHRHLRPQSLPRLRGRAAVGAPSRRRLDFRG